MDALEEEFLLFFFNGTCSLQCFGGGITGGLLALTAAFFLKNTAEYILQKILGIKKGFFFRENN